MKKAQMEIIGIAILAIMIIVLILLTIVLPQKKAQSNNEVWAMTSILSTTFACNGEEKPLSEFVIMCPDSCGCAAVAIDYLLPLEGNKHSFAILKNDALILERNTAKCAQKSLLLPSENGSIEVRLGIC